MTCTRCDKTGFLNIHQIPEREREALFAASDFHGAVLTWIDDPANHPHDVKVCDCCGNGDTGWDYEPGQHDVGHPGDCR